MTNKLVAKMTNGELLFAFKECNALIASELQRGAKILVEADKRGLLKGEANLGYWIYYKEIADGSLNPAAALLTSPTNLKYLLRLPVEKQEEIASGRKLIPTVIAGGDGTMAEEKIKFNELAPVELNRAFSATGVRPISEQRKLVSKSQRGRPVVHSNTTKYDPETEEIIKGGVHISIEQIARAITGHFQLVRVHKAQGRAA